MRLVASQIMVEPVEDVTAYGVVDCKGVESLNAGRKRTDGGRG